MFTATLQKLVVHYIGSKNNLEPCHYSTELVTLKEEHQEALEQGLLQRFKNNFEYYAFTHPSSLQFNEVFNYCKSIFEDQDNFAEAAEKIGHHLYEHSVHPRIKGGELYVALFDALPVESRMHQAIGIFKTEHKSFFLDVQHRKQQISLQLKEGVELSKIDKGCLVINRKEDQGFDVLLFDSQNRGEEAQYWKDKFLSLIPQQNEYHHTNQVLTLTKQFITQELAAEDSFSHTEKAELLNKSIDYFKSKDSFNIEEFQQEVFANDEIIESFKTFGSRFVENTNFDIAAQFDISNEAVRKQSRIFKSVLKLDRNFHIYIHGRTDLIERGVDTDGRKYYKIYYQEEA